MPDKADRTAANERRARWTTLRLTLHRGVGATSYAALVLRRGDGTWQWDRRLRTGAVDLPPGSRASADPTFAMVKALWAVMTDLERSQLMTWVEELGVAPPGPQGGHGGA